MNDHWWTEAAWWRIVHNEKACRYDYCECLCTWCLNFMCRRSEVNDDDSEV
jgi:hypothetical protein